MHILIEYLVFTDKSNYTIYIHDYTIKKKQGYLDPSTGPCPRRQALIKGQHVLNINKLSILQGFNPPVYYLLSLVPTRNGLMQLPTTTL